MSVKKINKKNGFTLVELLIVVSIMVVLAIMMLGAFNPSGMFNRGRDTVRKKDLNRIKIAFEEYFNDKGTYPLDVDSWNIKSNCGKNITTFPYLKPWPCDPNGNPYVILVYANKFKVLADLENKKDKDILAGWYTLGNTISLAGHTVDDVNYGVSSSNILWYELNLDDECSKYFHPENHNLDTCNMRKTNQVCQQVTGCKQENGVSCYASPADCVVRCQVPCCGTGCNN